MARIQVVIDPAEREEFRAQAEAEGRSLSEWLREAGRERVAAARSRRLESSGDWDRFWADHDAVMRDRYGDEPEPDWDDVKEELLADHDADIADELSAGDVTS